MSYFAAYIITRMNIDAFVPVDVVVSDSDLTSNGLYTIMCYRALVTAHAMNASGKVVNRIYEVHVESCDMTIATPLQELPLLLPFALSTQMSAISLTLQGLTNWIMATKSYGVLM